MCEKKRAKMNISLGYSKSMYSKEVTAITSLPMLYDILTSSVNYANQLHNSCVQNAIQSNQYNDYDQIIKSANKETKPQCNVIVPFYSEKGKKKEHFTQTNLIFVDIDDDVTNYSCTSSIFQSIDDFFLTFPEVVFAQKSANGKSHIVICVDDYIDSPEMYKLYTQAYYADFQRRFAEKYGNDDIYTQGVVDYHSASCCQLMYISKEPVYLNENIVPFDITAPDAITPAPAPAENNNNNNVNVKLSNFTSNPEVKYVKDSIYIDYTHTMTEVGNILTKVIDGWGNNKYGKLLRRPAIYTPGIYSTKLIYNLRRDEEGNIVRKQRGRRQAIKIFSKIAILNYFASKNAKKQGYTDVDVYYGDIITTIKWFITNGVEITGKKRNITDSLVISLLTQLYTDWSSLEVAYKANMYWFSDDIRSREDILRYAHICQRKKYECVNETAIEYIRKNKLAGTHSEIASKLNGANIASKHNVAWSAKSVERLYSNKPSTSDLNDKIDDMLEEGVKYAEIAKQLTELGYTTKQGKQITEITIKNYVRRKK
jgi:hypothetical protein